MIPSTFLVPGLPSTKQISYTGHTGAQNPLIAARLDRIAHEIGGELRGGSPALTIDRVCTYSRGAAPGALFIALRGQEVDGHRFLPDAFRNGATAALIAQDRISSLTLQPEWPVIVVTDPLRGLQALAG